MKQESLILIERWFEGLNAGDLPALLSLFSVSPRVRNAANPPQEGPKAAETLLNDFFARTSIRNFQVLDVAEGDGQIFAAWIGKITFKAGITIAGVCLPRTVELELRGVERFQVDEHGAIVELDIIHETTSLFLAVHTLSKVSD